MDADSQAAVIVNDLDSLVHRIEALPAHEEYTSALMMVQRAKDHVDLGRLRLHQQKMQERLEQR